MVGIVHGPANGPCRAGGYQAAAKFRRFHLASSWPAPAVPGWLGGQRSPPRRRFRAARRAPFCAEDHANAVREIDDNPAVQQCTPSYLTEALAATEPRVAVTPIHRPCPRDRLNCLETAMIRKSHASISPREAVRCWATAGLRQLCRAACPAPRPSGDAAQSLGPVGEHVNAAWPSA
jgi:hypothetical protein